MAGFLARHGGNIVHAEQHTDADEGVFFQRVEFELDGFDLDRERDRPRLSHRSPSGSACAVEVRFSDARPRVAHPRLEAAPLPVRPAARWRTGELDADIPLVISNHPDHADAGGASASSSTTSR